MCAMLFSFSISSLCPYGEGCLLLFADSQVASFLYINFWNRWLLLMMEVQMVQKE